MTTFTKRPGGVIFRRYIVRKNGKVDDARAHGLRAWPIRLRNPMRRKRRK